MLMPPPEGFDHAVVWQRGRSAVALDLAHKHLSLDDGSVHPYDALLIATGAAPNVLPIAGANLPHVFVLRSLADTHAIRQQAAACRHAVILGAGFIGLEAAAALRQQNIEVTVVSRDKAPMAALLGDALSGHVCARHTVRGVRFVLEAQAEQITPNAVVLRGGQKLDADLVIMGAGVTPDVAWVQKAGLATDVGILVDPNQRTSSRDIYAAGDVAQVRHSAASAGERFEHWAVAERMGQTAARSMLGLPQPAPAMPFFWSEHYDLKLRYVGHAAPLERAEVYGSLAQDKVAVALYSQGRIAAVATIGHDPLSLACEQALEAGDTARLGQLLHQA
jgi:NADPH-dependent 2,4-dienoyl-CoA reductase/sulfur reductase-like enzyme